MPYLDAIQKGVSENAFRPLLLFLLSFFYYMHFYTLPGTFLTFLLYGLLFISPSPCMPISTT